MPDRETLQRVEKDKREGKAPSTQAGEFIREEFHHVREGKHGVRNTKQAIAIGLSKARRAGVELPARNSQDAREEARGRSGKKRSAARRRSRAQRSQSARRAAATRRRSRSR